MADMKFSGGAALERKLREIAQKTGKSNTVRVGFLEGATYPDKDHTPVAQVAAINEFGAPEANIPPRPFFRTMIEKNKGEWANDLGQILVATGYDAKRTFGMMGKGIKDQLVDSIESFSAPRNADATIAKKGFNDPLVDTGHMKSSADFEVNDE